MNTLQRMAFQRGVTDGLVKAAEEPSLLDRVRSATDPKGAANEFKNALLDSKFHEQMIDKYRQPIQDMVTNAGNQLMDKAKPWMLGLGAVSAFAPALTNMFMGGNKSGGNPGGQYAKVTTPSQFYNQPKINPYSFNSMT